MRNSQQNLEAPLIWGIPTDFPEQFIGHYVRERSPDRFVFRKGQIVDRSLGIPTFSFHSDSSELADLDALPNDARLPLVCKPVSELIKELAPDEVQVLDARVEFSDVQSTSDWKLLNTLRMVEAIDHDASDYTLVPGTKQILSFRRLRFRGGALGDLRMARDMEFKSHLLVHPVIARALLSRGARGVAFKEAAELDT